jgi:hypothetical protein
MKSTRQRITEKKVGNATIRKTLFARQLQLLLRNHQKEKDNVR